jgi:hypothetical protein
MSGIYRGPGGTGDAVNDASSETRLAVEARDAAIAAKVAAEAARDAALTAETNAETAEANAETAETNAETAEANAETAEANAETAQAAAEAAQAAAEAAQTAAELAETNAETAETNAASSASAASTSASNAATSATNASNSASAASTSATNAANSATSASTSATTATTQATNAATSATSAASSATSASASAAAASAVALGNEPVRHSVRPSLLLDFANTKTLDPRITFTRASTGTYYDGKTVAKAEENTHINSETINLWNLPTNATITTNAAVAPNGTTTAEKVIANNGVANCSVVQTASATAGTNRIASIYAKADGFNFIAIGTNGSFTTTEANLSTGVISSGSGTITSVGNGWYRISTPATNFNNNAPFFQVRETSGTATLSTADGVKGVLMWGAQVEARDTVTAYTATTTAPITNYIPALQTAASGVARFEHNPVTGESLGLEIEEQRTNLCLRSQEFDNSAWNALSGTLVVTPNTVIAPDGTQSGDTITLGNHYKVQSVTVSSGTAYTFSVWMRTDTGTKNVQLREVNGSGQSMVSVTTSWQRFTFTYTSSGTTNFIGIDQRSGTSPSQSGDIYIWGAQLEAGSFATSYIPTVASQVTRVQDTASIPTSSFNYKIDESTIFARLNLVNPQSSAIRQIFQGDALPTMALTTTQVLLSVPNVGEISGFNFSYSTGTSFNAVVAFKNGDSSAVANGGTPTSSTTVHMPKESGTYRIGSNYAVGTQTMNGSISKIAVYPKRLTSAELVGLTTI